MSTDLLPHAATSQDRLTRWLSPRLASWIAVLSLAIALAAIVVFGSATRAEKPTDNLPAGSESAQFAELTSQLPERSDDAVVLIEAPTGQLDAAAVQQARSLSEQLRASEGSFAVSPDKSAAIFSAPLQASTEEQKIEAVKALRAELAATTPDGLTAEPPRSCRSWSSGPEPTMRCC